MIHNGLRMFGNFEYNGKKATFKSVHYEAQHIKYWNYDYTAEKYNITDDVKRQIQDNAPVPPNTM